jgi:hypothetical protein
VRSLAIVALLAVPAHADPQLTPILPGDSYSIDLYEGVALGNSAVVAMGGATVANAAGSSGTLANPSAPAVRQTTDTDVWSWDYHLDYLNASASKDYANSGLGGATGGAQDATAGLSGRYRDWGAAITVSYQTAPLGTSPVTLPNGAMSTLEAQTLHGRIAFAHWFPSRDIAIGAAFQLAQLDIKPTCTGSGCGSLFTVSGPGLEAGATYIPRWQSYRLGVSGTSKITGGNVTVTNCDPQNCDGYVLPDSVRVPWRVAVGGAYRWAESEWNQVVGGDFRDEPSLTVAADVVVSGASSDAYGLDAFSQMQFERSGSHVVYSLRGGAEYEWLPGRLRVRGGSYWEPGRFDGVPGRVHGTFGIEVRALEFELWGRRRGRITLTGDLASRYDNVGISIGFWH